MLASAGDSAARPGSCRKAPSALYGKSGGQSALFLLSEIADEVGRTHERVHSTRNGREHVVLLAAEDLESIEATLELLTDTRAQERIAAAEADFAAGEVLDEQQVRALMDKPARTRPE